MNITYNELRKLKHSLPTGSISRIAAQLGMTEQTVRNFFGAQKSVDGQLVGWHLEPGPDGGIFNVENTTIFDAAKSILEETKATTF